jgi:hypothetical protein
VIGCDEARHQLPPQRGLFRLEAVSREVLPQLVGRTVRKDLGRAERIPEGGESIDLLTQKDRRLRYRRAAVARLVVLPEIVLLVFDL